MRQNAVRHLSITAIIMIVALWPTPTAAQTGAVAGTVLDSTGGVLPGVVVEASSPALIEGARSAVTDVEGRYRIIDLRPGTYVVTFTLPGFSTFVRDGLEFSAAFTATVDAQLRIGAVEETITVTGQAPLVDVQNVTATRVMTRELIDKLPTGKTWQNMAVLIPGVIVHSGASTAGGVGHDVGGAFGERQSRLKIHGSYQFDTPLTYDGMPYNNMNQQTGGSRTIWMINTGSVEEITLETVGLSAETATGGMRANVIPKQGGNIYSGYFLANFTNHQLQASNISDEQRTLGFRDQTAINKIWDINPAFGGPIIKDRLWFYTAFRYWGVYDAPPGAFKDTDPLDFAFTPDLNQPVINETWNRSTNVRLTWQAAPDHKFSLFADPQQRCTCAWSASSTLAFEASTVFHTEPNSMFQGTWSWTASNQLLVEAGYTAHPEAFTFEPQPSVGINLSNVRELTTGIRFRSPPNSLHRSSVPQKNAKFSVSYVTGAHSLKVGAQLMTGYRHSQTHVANDVRLDLFQGVPTRVNVRVSPNINNTELKMGLGLYAQEQWNVSNALTLNLGLRMDHLNAYVPEQNLLPTRFLGPRNFPRVDEVPNWTELSPRFGVVWDVLGGGRTAVKASLGRYVEGITTVVAVQNNPAAQVVTSANRPWIDANGDFIPQDEELGPLTNSSFGQVVVRSRWDPDLLTGFGNRKFNWEASASIQHELRTGLSLEASYNRRWFGNHRVRNNLETGPGDYDPFCITAPTDPRLPTSGQELCGLFDVKPERFGLVDNLTVLSDEFGTQTEVYNGVDLTANIRLANGIVFQGGTSTGRTHLNDCFVIDSPQQLRFCDVVPPLLTQMKLLGVYPLPWWNLTASATFQSIPGTEITADLVVPNADIAPSLGRDLAGRRRTVLIPLISPGSLYGDRLNQLDFRFSAPFRAGGIRFEPQFDLYNALNSNPVLAMNGRFGSAWQRPVNILAGRLFKVGVQMDF